MESNDSALYQGDLDYDSLKALADRKARDWAKVAGELGFATVSEEDYWRKDQGGMWRLNHYYRLFLILVASGIEQLKDVEEMFSETSAHRQTLEMINHRLGAKGITFYAIPYDILTLLVISTLGSRARMHLGVHAWRDDIQRALHEITGVELPS
jgi:hypothetical protein